jgi:type IV pilus assembly protein PilM
VAAQGVIESVNAEVAAEIARTIDYFKSTVSEGDVQQVLLCGGGAQIAGLVKQLRDRMQAVVEVANPFAEVDTSASDFDQATLAEMAPMASVGVGLALRSVGDR